MKNIHKAILLLLTFTLTGCAIRELGTVGDRTFYRVGSFSLFGPNLAVLVSHPVSDTNDLQVSNVQSNAGPGAEVVGSAVSAAGFATGMSFVGRGLKDSGDEINVGGSPVNVGGDTINVSGGSDFPPGHSDPPGNSGNKP